VQEKIIFFKPEIAFLKYCRFCNCCFHFFSSINPAETFNGKLLQKNSIESTYSQHFKISTQKINFYIKDKTDTITEYIKWCSFPRKNSFSKFY